MTTLTIEEIIEKALWLEGSWEASIRWAIEQEREACAEICDRFQARDVGMQPAECAGAIRARGEA
jgi:hypothetical protein